jgi:hypothetical protein
VDKYLWKLMIFTFARFFFMKLNGCIYFKIFFLKKPSWFWNYVLSINNSHKKTSFSQHESQLMLIKFLFPITFSYHYQKNCKKIESFIINFNFIVNVITLIINFILKTITQIINFILKILTIVIDLLDYHHSTLVVSTQVILFLEMLNKIK